MIPSATQKQTAYEDVEGEVMRPGVYEVGTDSRLQDVLIKAGGISENANRDVIAKTVNLAMKVNYGMNI